MNMQAMLQQAERMQKEILNSKKEIEQKTYFLEKELVSIEMSGNKKLLSIKIKKDTIEKEDIEILEDMIVLLINECHEKIDAEMEEKLSKYGPAVKGII